jgi:hypothetical protein
MKAGLTFHACLCLRVAYISSSRSSSPSNLLAYFFLASWDGVHIYHLLPPRPTLLLARKDTHACYTLPYPPLCKRHVPFALRPFLFSAPTYTCRVARENMTRSIGISREIFGLFTLHSPCRSPLSALSPSLQSLTNFRLITGNIID